jgi:Alpha amylase, catalytic domain/Secretion system C-terminal sorting domain
MKKITQLLLLCCSFSFWAQQQNISFSVSPTAFEENQSITLTFPGTSINEGTWGVTGNALYLWAWSYDINDANIIDSPTNGTWTNSNETNRLTYNSGTDTYTYTLTPNTFYGRSNIGRIGFLVKAKDGTGDKKSQDMLVEVGLFNITLTSPTENSATIINSGGSLTISASNTNGNASYNLKANGISINNASNVATYSFNHTNITANTSYVLEVTQASLTKSKKFSVIVNPGTISQAIPGGLVDGINYNSSDATRATVVLTAPGKDFVYVAGSFNSYQPTGAFAMKKDPTSGKFWLEITGLTSGQIEHYQYWVVDQTPIANSPSLVKTADPYSTLVLSPFDDPWTPATSYPNMPVYPSGQEREVTVLQTGQTPYSWTNTSFTKPKKEDLIIYEVLVRDFDEDRNYQDLIDKIDYFKNLKINAIELMPVMEFEGNESWGYNTSFHMALDKHYGTSDKFKEFIDLCHSNGIAVILDLALNHAFGRNPMNRMWMNDADNDGWGDPASDNPYFNTTARHSYSVGSDFNHASMLTRDYTKRVIKHWIEEYKIDGFRWDLTKGFTQNCSGSDDSCTNSYQQDRVDILKEYADYSWGLDPTHYVIFEHLGSENEEKEWANYRINESPSKGVMMWGEMHSQYELLAKGVSGANISGVGHKSRSTFAGKRLIGYPESHDKDRLAFAAFTDGNSGGTYPVRGNLTNTIKKMSAIGAASILVPGPKMIWHFADLGMDDSIYTCTNGSVNYEGDPTPGDCKLATKPQPQWSENWLNDTNPATNRREVYNNWRKFNILKTQEAVFEGDYAISQDGTSTVKQRIYIYDNSLPSTSLKNVVVLANFSVADLNFTPDFPYTGTWYNLMDNTSINVTNTTSLILVPSGGFRVYGNQLAQSLLSNDEFETLTDINLYPNPSNNYFQLSKAVETVEIYTITGQKIKGYEGGFSSDATFDISELSNGLYLVKLKDVSNRATTLKLVKK